MQRTRDLVSGEELWIVYFPKVDEITINGYSVIRSDGFSDWVGQSVFHQALGDKKYTIATDVIAKLCS